MNQKTAQKYETVIGLEVHAQVTSNAKLFSGASTKFGNEQNSNVSLVDAAMPGMLPVINEECVRQAVKTVLNTRTRPLLFVSPGPVIGRSPVRLAQGLQPGAGRFLAIHTSAPFLPGLRLCRAARAPDSAADGPRLSVQPLPSP